MMETREQAVARYHRDEGPESDYLQTFAVEMGDGSTESLTVCGICRAHLEGGFIKHLHYCPFVGVYDRLRDAAPDLLRLYEACRAFGPQLPTEVYEEFVRVRAVIEPIVRPGK